MTLKLPDKWIWDFWLAQDGPDYHIFYLQAPKSLLKEPLRHWHVSVGHAVSPDLRRWEILPDALHPSRQAGAWDDYTTWTGSIIRQAGLWYMFYTGSRRAEKGLVQRIGLATSTDLLHWERHPHNPLLTIDPRWYELLDLELWHDQGWRDPWVFQAPDTGDFHAFITARANHGPSHQRGVIAHARSKDLLQWEVLPPVAAPAQFGDLEVPQLVEINNRYYLLFCTRLARPNPQTGRLSSQTVVMGTHYLVSDSLLGPYRLTTAATDFLVGDSIGSLYAGKLIKGPNQSWQFMAARQFTPDGDFLGYLTDPFPVSIGDDGALAVNWRVS